MSPKKTYFLAPSRDQAPTGVISLGNLIKSPRGPEFALNDTNSETVKRLQASAYLTPEIDATREWTNKLTVRPNVFASFLWGLLGEKPVDLGFNLGKDDSITYTIARLETKTINPSLADVRAIFSEKDVQDTIRDSKFTANLYMITAVQIAHGAEYVISKAREHGANLHGAVDLTAATGVPATVGGGIEGNLATGAKSKGKIEGSFVFAYGLREVLYKRKTVTEQRHTKMEGDLMEHGGKKLKEEEEIVLEYEAELAGLKAEDPELPEYWDMDIDTGLDLDGDECQIVRVDGEDDDDD